MQCRALPKPLSLTWALGSNSNTISSRKEMKYPRPSLACLIASCTLSQKSSPPTRFPPIQTKCSGVKTWLSKPDCAWTPGETSAPRPMAGTAQPFGGEWDSCPKKPGHLLGSMQERALDLYFLFKLMGWVDQRKYLGVEHISRELIIVTILCRLLSRVSVQEGFEITSSD